MTNGLLGVVSYIALITDQWSPRTGILHSSDNWPKVS